MADFKLDIFAAMRAMDDHDGDWFSRQSDEAKKGFAPPVFLRWASAVKGDGMGGEYTILTVNERLNKGFWQIVAADPELAFRLAATCGTKLGLEHQWIPLPGRVATVNKARDLVASFYPSANDREIDMLMSKFTRESFRQFANEAGITADEVKEVNKAYDRLGGKIDKVAKDETPKPKRAKKAKK